MREKNSIVRKLLGLFLFTCLLGMLPVLSAAASDVVIVLDPGHGGTEKGAFRTWNGVTYEEEILNLKIAQYAKAELETYAGVQVYLTRTTNDIAFMDRKTRLNFAKSKKATALVSIHINSTSDNKTRKESGSFAVVPSIARYPDNLEYARSARELGTVILKSLNAYVGTKNNGFWLDDELGIILYGMQYKIPSTIIEHCFVNNPDDCKAYLQTEAQLQKLGVADALGIAQYYNLRKKSDVTVKKGWQTENGKRVYYKNNVKYRNGWKKISGKYYYFDSTGALRTGLIQLGSKMYITDANGVRQTGLVKVKKKWYYANSKGVLSTGWKTIKKKRYYFDKTTGAAYTGIKNIGSKKYYFSKTTGAMQKKWVQVSPDRLLYFSTKDGAMLKNRWLKSNGKYYYLGKDGRPYTNTKKKINGKVYRFNKKGVCKNR